MTSYGTSRERGQSNAWEDWTNLILGIWLIASPWVFHFATASAAVWNAWISGCVIAVLAAAALYQVQKWEEWTSAVIGIWLVVSPWVLGFSSDPVTTSNAVIVGLLVLCVAGWELYTLLAETSMQHLCSSRCRFLAFPAVLFARECRGIGCEAEQSCLLSIPGVRTALLHRLGPSTHYP